MLLTSSVALGVAISQYGSCYSDCGGAAAAAGIALGVDLISLIDAGSAANRHNKKLLEQRQVGVAPVLTPRRVAQGSDFRYGVDLERLDWTGGQRSV